MVMTRGMKKALSQKTSVSAKTSLTARKAKRRATTRTHPMRTRHTTPQMLPDTTDAKDDDDDDKSIMHRLYCAENEILRLTNVNNSLSLNLQTAIANHTNLTARLNRLEALLPPPPPGHPLPIKEEAVDHGRESVDHEIATVSTHDPLQ